MTIGFDQALLFWYDANKRDLPWRRTKDAYAIWVSEIMLQQTRVETVKSYYQRFLEKFPTLEALANASEQEVLKVWEGLGYYSRARHLQQGAQCVMEKFGGEMPHDAQELRTLPGIGPYTAGAVASIAFGEKTPAVDGNVERVLSRVCGIRDDIGIPSVRRALSVEALAHMSSIRPGDFNQAMMELGACVCTSGTPDCARCPISSFCDAYDAGDADMLPHKQRAKPQKLQKWGIALIFQKDRILVRMRKERLLQGLWEFPSALNADTPEKVQACQEIPDTLSFIQDCGEARHVFTHLIWEMRIFAFSQNSPSFDEDTCWVDAQTLAQLPFPTALRRAREEAIRLLQHV